MLTLAEPELELCERFHGGSAGDLELDHPAPARWARSRALLNPNPVLEPRPGLTQTPSWVGSNPVLSNPVLGCGTCPRPGLRYLPAGDPAVHGRRPCARVLIG